MTVRLDVVPLRDDIRFVAAIAAALVDHAQTAIDGAIGRALQPDVDAGLHRQTAFVERLRAVFCSRYFRTSSVKNGATDRTGCGWPE